MILSILIGLAPRADASLLEVAPTTIDATGSTDVTEKLQAFIDRTPDGSTISFPAGARYRVDGSLLIEARKGLTFEGNGAEFFATTEGDRERRHWWIRNSDGITIRDVVIHGANPNAGMGDAAYRADREAQHGFDFAGTKNALLERVTVTDVYGDFVYIGLAKAGWSKSVTVRDSTFERNGRQGISITAGEDIRIEHNYISQVRRSTFDIEPNSPDWGARRVTISDNDIGPGRLNFLAGHGSAGLVDDIVVIGNRLKGKTMNVSLKAPTARRRSDFSLIGNVSDASFGSSIAAVTIEGFDGVTIHDNVLPLAAGRDMTAVAFKATCDTSVAGNQFVNAARDVATDDYKCTKATVPTTTMAASATTRAAAAGPSPSTTTRRASTGPTVPSARVTAGGNDSTEAPSGSSAGREDPGGHEREDESGQALPNDDGRLVDPPRVGSTGAGDNAIWSLVAGALISLAVLIPLSRRRR
ncbi:MAG: right-handed parallel beta-helix repeat-containing protein [Acidimicrobiales bacterium]